MSHAQIAEIVAINKKPFLVHLIDPGFAKVVYRCKNPQGETIYYAFYQEAPEKFALYRVCQKFEAQGLAHTKEPLGKLFQFPGGTSQIEVDLRNYLMKTIL